MQTVFNDDDPWDYPWENTTDIVLITITNLEPEFPDDPPMFYPGPWRIRYKSRIIDYPPYETYGGLVTYYPNSTFNGLWLILPLTPQGDVKLEAHCEGCRIEFPLLHFDDYHGLWKTLPSGDNGYHYMLYSKKNSA